jgi:hypothetical protein
MALLDELRKHGTRAFAYVVVEGWGPRLDNHGVGAGRPGGRGVPVEVAASRSSGICGGGR